MRPGLPSAIVIVAVCCVFSACDDSDVAPPTSPTSRPAFVNRLDSVAIVPSAFGRDGVPPVCPSLSRFSVPFILNVTAGTRPLTLSEVRLQPTNPFGRTSPPTVFDASSLTRRFGSVTVPSFVARQFSFTHDLTCDMRGSMLEVSVTMTDGTGMNRVSTMQVPVH